jgi:hypothetical protein
MPTPVTRPSITTDLQTRYANQHEGGAFDVKKTLGSPGHSPQAGTTMPVNSQLAKQFLTPPDFLVKEMVGITQFKDAAAANNSSSGKSKELSVYLKGFSNRKYKP